jgi:polysaccharide pyruvyl transferase WcaK-like protein
VGLLWHSVNQGNLGVGALTAGNIIIVERAAERLGIAVEFVVIGWQNEGGAAYIEKSNLRLVALTGRDFRPGGALSDVVAGCDLVLDIGAGDSFSDIYGWKRFTYLALSKWLVLRAKCPLILSPQTLGPFRNRAARRVASALIRRAEAVFARDRKSIEALAGDAVARGIRETTDVAFRLPYDAPPAAAPGRQTARVGLNLSALLFHGQARFAMTCDFQSLARQLLSAFSARERCEVVLVPHVFSNDPQEDDYRLAETLAGTCPGVTVAPRFRGPCEAKTFIAGLDFFAGARMHACIAAFSAGVPVVPLAYSRKFSGLFGALGYDWVVDCTQVDARTACAAVLDGFDRRAELAAAVATGNRTADTKLQVYEAAVTDALGDAAGRALARASSVADPRLYPSA